jgi:hypothetical protein
VTGPLDCFLQTIRAEGFIGLYKGLTAPLVGAMIENSGLFLAYNQVQSVVRSLSATPAKTELNLQQLALCGFFSGAIVSLILTPVELVKCKIQVNFYLFSPFFLRPFFLFYFVFCAILFTRDLFFFVGSRLIQDFFCRKEFSIIFKPTTIF